MDFESAAGTMFVGTVGLSLVGLLVLAMARTPIARLLGIREGEMWWFSPAGTRTQGFVVAYVSALLAVGSLSFLAVKTVIPTSGALAWTAAWTVPALVLAGTGTRAGRVLVHLASNGRAALEDPEESDYVDPDDVLDDLDARAARDAALKGDWRPAAHLLAATSDPQSRYDRIEVLATASLRRGSWLDAWFRERPNDPNVLALRAHAALQRAWEYRGAEWEAKDPERFLETLDDAEALAREALVADPTDPCPYATLVALARGQQVDPAELDRRLAALRAVVPDHVQGHEQALQYKCAKWFGSSEEMFAFAREASSRARPGSSLNLLIVVAHLEHWADLSTRSTGRADAHMAAEPVRAEIAEAVRRWESGVDGPSPVGRAQGHNLLAFTSWLAKDPAAARPHLARTREHLATWPWGVVGEPREVHAQVQAWSRQHTPRSERDVQPV